MSVPKHRRQGPKSQDLTNRLPPCQPVPSLWDLGTARSVRSRFQPASAKTVRLHPKAVGPDCSKPPLHRRAGSLCPTLTFLTTTVPRTAPSLTWGTFHKSTSKAFTEKVPTTILGNSSVNPVILFSFARLFCASLGT